MQSSITCVTVSRDPENTKSFESDGNVARNQENCFKNLKSDFFKTSQNLNTQKTHNPQRDVTERSQAAFKQPCLNMDKALNTLWEIEYCIKDKDAQKQLGLKTESGFWGTLKNAFCKFLGFFCNAVKENRTNALNQQIGNVLRKICKSEDFYKNVLLPVMNDGDIDEELKTACFNLFEDKEKLFLDLKNPNADIREQFWERNKEKIQNGSILKELLGIKNLSANMKRDDFINCNGNPLKEMVFKGLKTIPEKEDFINKDVDIIAESFDKKEILNFVQDKNDLKRYLDCYAGVLNKPGYMEKWLKMVTEEPKKGEELSKLQNKVSGIKDFFSGTKNFDEISNLGLGTKDVFADLDRNPPANGSITFDFGLKGSIELNTSKIRSKSKKDFFEDIKKQVTDLKLNENEISRLADFLCTVEPQGYMLPLRMEFNFEEHSFKLHVSFEENQTKITMPLKDEPVTLLLNAGIYSKNSAHLNGVEGAENLKQKLTGKHMSGTMEVIAKGTSMINSETTTEFKNFRINVPDF